MRMGKGAITSVSRKQKLNTRSSAEAEIVAVDDCMSQVLWTKHFLEDLGHPMEAITTQQDNSSAIKLETNGMKSMGQRSKHINNRCFFIANQLKKGNVKVEHCPTDDMEGDCHAKPLQGSKFTKHRTSLMNLPQKDATSKKASTAVKKAVAFGQSVIHEIPRLRRHKRQN